MHFKAWYIKIPVLELPASHMYTPQWLSPTWITQQKCWRGETKGGPSWWKLSAFSPHLDLEHAAS
jgi:hypothetical protein